MLQLHYVLQLTAIMAHWILILVFQTLKCHYFPIVPRYCKDKHNRRDLNVPLKPWRAVTWLVTVCHYMRHHTLYSVWSIKEEIRTCHVQFRRGGGWGLVPLGDITSHATFFFSAWLNFIPITVIRIFLHIYFFSPVPSLREMLKDQRSERHNIL